jgi:hypothetical protein
MKAILNSATFTVTYTYKESRHSRVGIDTRYVLNDRGVGVLVAEGSRIFTSSYRPDRILDSLNLVSNGFGRSFPRDKAAEE